MNHKLKSLIPKTCPHCGEAKSFVIDDARMACGVCGYVLRDADGSVVSPQPERKKSSPIAEALRRRNITPTYRITTRGEIERWARVAFDTGIDCVRQEKWDEALKAFRRSLENQKDFLDPHLWIAYISDDPKVKEEHLTTILAYDPTHMEALRELMILRGELDASVVDGQNDPHAAANIQQSGGAVSLHTQNVRCSQCGSTEMAVDPISGNTVCDTCGHVEAVSRQQHNIGGLTQALLKRRYKAIVWKTGEHFLECDSCGAKRTIPARKMSDQCPFCGSQHIFERDALDTFQQPDGVVQFGIRREDAMQALEQKLGSWSEKMKGWFANNRVDRVQLTPIFLPFWVFDVALDIRKTTIRDNVGVGNSRDSAQNSTVQSGYETIMIPDGINNVLVCAVDSPAPALTRKLGKFTLSHAVAYSPKLLAKVPAELYSMDFDKASLQARDIVGGIMKEKHGADNIGSTRTNVFSQVKHMNFRLMLLPVWSATILEEDGDLRPALINGQSGEVALGKAQK